MTRLAVVLSILLAAGVHAQDAPTIARMVNDLTIDAAALAKAVSSADALTRAAAARVALVRGVAIVPALREQLAAESNAATARELVRAIVILGSNDDVDFASKQLARFPASIDVAFAGALERTSRDVAPYREHLRATPFPAFSLSKQAQREMPGINTPVKPPEFAVPFVLPRGLGDAIIRATRCKSDWVGVANITRDAFGRVQDVDAKGVYADRACTEAFRTIARLVLADPGPAASTPLLVFRSAQARPCFDEAAVTNTVPPLSGGTPTAPKVLRRVEPRVPPSVLRKGGGQFSVVAEATITSEGCVRDLRLVQQTIYPELNRALLEALSKWTFTPGTLNGVPVDVVFNLSTNFRF
ncbi:MAG TPA: energy transducer TonB [Thermoanaerobaculia bacterium]|nr:energy transducer TonB [Thermoanaerobaculia bacterium]